MNRIRVYITGSCDGLDTLRQALSEHPDLDMVGWSENVLEAAPALTGGHLQCVLHATRSSTLPADELAQMREHTQAPIVILASGEASALLEQALDSDVADVLLLPQLADNVVFSIRKALLPKALISPASTWASTATLRSRRLSR
jgi:DNA-binding NarL/FixJ family response regulator